MKRVFACLIALAAIIGAATALRADEARVGAVTPLTGSLSGYGLQIQKAMLTALGEINAAGGVNGKAMRIEFADNGSTSDGSIAAIVKLIDRQRLPIVFGPAASKNFLAVCKIAQSRGTVLISAESAASSIADCGDFVFRLNPSDQFQAEALARLAKDRGYRRVGLIYIDTAWGRELTVDFKTDFTRAGGRVVVHVSHRPGQADFADAVRQLAASGTPAVVVLSHVKEAAALLRNASEAGFKPVWIFGSAAKSPALVAAAGKAAEGVLGAYPKVPSNTPQFRSYQAAFEKRYPGEALPFFGAFNYDMVMLAANALGRAKSNDPESVRAALIAAAKGYAGASGEKTFDKDGQSPGTFGFWTVRNGDIVDFNPNP